MRLVVTLDELERRTQQLERAWLWLTAGRLCAEWSCMRRSTVAVRLPRVRHEIGLCSRHLADLLSEHPRLRTRRLGRTEVLHGPNP